MCGIAGAYADNLSEYETTIVEHMIMTSGIRGMDSTGVFGVYSEKGKLHYNYHKDNECPHDFIAYGMQKGVFRHKKGIQKVAVGHNRAATVGKPTKKNSHPFSAPNVIGVHNGTISASLLKHSSLYETDSEALYHEISDIGLDAMIKKLGRNGNCAYALVMLDKKTSTLRIVRNEERPLSFAWRLGTLYFASENLHLEWCLNRYSGVNPRMAAVDYKAEEFKPFHVYEINIHKSPKVKEFSAIRDLTPPRKYFPVTQARDSAPWDPLGVSDSRPLGFRGGGKIRGDGAFHYHSEVEELIKSGLWDEENDRPLEQPLALPKPSPEQTSTTPTTAATQTGTTTDTLSTKPKPKDVLHEMADGRVVYFREGIKPPFHIARGRVRVWNTNAKKWMLVHWEAQEGKEEIDPTEDVPGPLNDPLPSSMLDGMPEFLKRNKRQTHLEKLEEAMDDLGPDTGIVSWKAEDHWQDEEGKIWTYGQVCSAIKHGCCISGDAVTIGEVTAKLASVSFQGCHALKGVIVDNHDGTLAYICEDMLNTELASQYVGTKGAPKKKATK